MNNEERLKQAIKDCIKEINSIMIELQEVPASRGVSAQIVRLMKLNSKLSLLKDQEGNYLITD